jgi:hypothetical protein
VGERKERMGSWSEKERSAWQKKRGRDTLRERESGRGTSRDRERDTSREKEGEIP